ncbi:MAG: hypothetical protein AAFU71_03230 [Cyanobacteria bacterium J06632_22]
MTRVMTRFNRSACASAVAGVVLTGSLGIAQPAQADPGTDISSSAVATPVQPLLAEAPVLPADGFYLFGEQPVADQLATAYFVFELQAGLVTGAFYMPHSSFDCVQGQMGSTELALTITDSYSQEQYAYALALTQDTLIASTGEVSAFSLSGFQQLEQLSENDHRLIETCQAAYGDVI